MERHKIGGSRKQKEFARPAGCDGGANLEAHLGGGFLGDNVLFLPSQGFFSKFSSQAILV